MLHQPKNEALKSTIHSGSSSLRSCLNLAKFVILFYAKSAAAIMGEPVDPIHEANLAGVCRIQVVESGEDAQRRPVQIALSLCTGTLIDEESFPASLRDQVSRQPSPPDAAHPQRSRYLLTAAHCDPSLSGTSSPAVEQRLNELRNRRRSAIAECRGYGPERISSFKAEVAAFFRNPAWKNETSPSLENAAHDLGVARLDQSIPVSPVMLPEAGSSQIFFGGRLSHYCGAGGVGEDRFGRLGRINIVQIPPALPAQMQSGLVGDRGAVRLSNDPRAFEIRPGDSGGPILCNTIVDRQGSAPTIYAVQSIGIYSGGLISELLAARSLRMAGFASVLVESKLPEIVRGFRAVQPTAERPGAGSRIREFFGR